MSEQVEQSAIAARVGAHRVVAPPGALPQNAVAVDPQLPLRPTEAAVRVELLHLDAASFAQLRDSVGSDPERIAERVMEIVRERGKMQNPATGSGGVLVGRLSEAGPEYPLPQGIAVGDQVCPMVSLSLIPLVLERIDAVDMTTGQLTVQGTAVLFASMPVQKVPDDLPLKATLAALDVAGAPAYAQMMVRPGMRVLVLGGGKSGLLTMWVARRKLGKTGTLVALDANETACARIAALGVADAVVQTDARNALAATEAVLAATDGEFVDLSINCVSVPDAEMAAILPTADDGQVVFLNMGTSFTKAALGAEGVGRSPTMPLRSTRRQTQRRIERGHARVDVFIGMGDGDIQLR
jgi:L-erythro-3,5-diaminohexanoate dehydrogenase